MTENVTNVIFALNKLVRDKVTDNFKKNNITFTCEYINGVKLKKALLNKLVEEANEVLSTKLKADTIEELCDVWEVLSNILKQYNINFQELFKYQHNVELDDINKKNILHNFVQQSKVILEFKDRDTLIKELQYFWFLFLTILKLYNLSLSTITNACSKKNRTRGNFSKGLFIYTVELDPDNEMYKFFTHYPKVKNHDINLV